MSSKKNKSLLPSTERHDPFAALRFRNYRLFIMGRILLFTSFQIRTLAVGWELYERTNSAMVLGGIGLVQIIPLFALTLIAGHLADQYDRKQIMLITVILSALSSLGLALCSYIQAPILLVYACLFFSSIGRAFNKPAVEALMYQLVPTSAFTNAAAWNNSGSQIAAIVGPALGGVLIAVFKGVTGVYVLAAGAALLCFGFVFLIKEKKTVRSTERFSLSALSAGVRFIWQDQLVLAVITLDLFAVLLGGAVALLPLFAKDILRVGPVELGWLQASPSIGAVIMAVTVAHLPPFRKAGQTLLWTVVGFGVVTIIFGLSRSFWLSLWMLALSGAFDSISVVIRNTLVQTRTPNTLRGRVSAINGLVISTSDELGGFQSGLTTALFGPVLSVVGGGIGAIAVVIATALIFPNIRRLETLQEYK